MSELESGFLTYLSRLGVGPVAQEVLQAYALELAASAAAERARAGVLREALVSVQRKAEPPPPLGEERDTWWGHSAANALKSIADEAKRALTSFGADVAVAVDGALPGGRGVTTPRLLKLREDAAVAAERAAAVAYLRRQAERERKRALLKHEPAPFGHISEFSLHCMIADKFDEAADRIECGVHRAALGEDRAAEHEKRESPFAEWLCPKCRNYNIGPNECALCRPKRGEGSTP